MFEDGAELCDHRSGTLAEDLLIEKMTEFAIDHLELAARHRKSPHVAGHLAAVRQEHERLQALPALPRRPAALGRLGGPPDSREHRPHALPEVGGAVVPPHRAPQEQHRLPDLGPGEEPLAPRTR